MLCNPWSKYRTEFTNLGARYSAHVSIANESDGDIRVIHYCCNGCGIPQTIVELGIAALTDGPRSADPRPIVGNAALSLQGSWPYAVDVPALTRRHQCHRSRAAVVCSRLCLTAGSSTHTSACPASSHITTHRYGGIRAVCWTWPPALPASSAPTECWHYEGVAAS